MEAVNSSTIGAVAAAKRPSQGFDFRVGTARL
jgi:hypothetical protein